MNLKHDTYYIKKEEIMIEKDEQVINDSTKE